MNENLRHYVNRKKMTTQTKKSLPTEQLVVLVSEHVELYDMTNKLYHNMYHKESIWRMMGGILGHKC